MRDQIIEIARKVRKSYLKRSRTTQGGCREISVALAVAAASLGKPVCICCGHVMAKGERHEHTWCRIEHQIIDVSADQFGLSEDVLIAHELELTQYTEETFLIFRPSEVRAILEEVQ